jgi:ABC-type transporter Mla MlaB component
MSHLSLPPELRIDDVAELQKVLLEAVQVHGCLTVEAADVCEIDLAGVQLLIAFQRARSALGAETVWQAPSATLVSALDLMGLLPMFGLEPQGETH